MRIIQVLPNITPNGDAVSNDCIAINDILRNSGYNTRIYAEYCSEKNYIGISSIEELRDVSNNDILIYHCSIGWAYTKKIRAFSCYKIMRFHNITPPEFFEGYNEELKKLTSDGYKELHLLNNVFDYCLADSEYNKNELIRMGYTCKIDVLPVLIQFEKYNQTPNKEVIARYSSNEKVKLLFTGRIAPNKKIEDILKAFYAYKKCVSENAILFLVGSYLVDDIYYRKLVQIINIWALNNVIFLGHIPFDEVLAYYTLSDIFLCMSEHEGFCVPLLEAMYFNIPIIAYESTAVTQTLGKSNILVKHKNYAMIAEIINQVVINLELKEKLKNSQKDILKKFNFDFVKNTFLRLLDEILTADFVKRGKDYERISG